MAVPGRRLRTALILVALLVLLGAMGVYGYKAATHPFPGSAKTTKSCTKQEISKQRYLSTKDITVSVYNAGARKHFAALTQSRLESRGFRAGALGNAPFKVKVARVFTTSDDLSSAKLVARNLGVGIPVVHTDNEMGPGIDIFVGPRLGYLNPRHIKRIKLAKPIETCVKVS